MYLFFHISKQCVNSYQLCKLNFMKTNLHFFYQQYNFLSSTAACNFMRSNVYWRKKSDFENPYEEILQNKKDKFKNSPSIYVIDLNKKTTVKTLNKANKEAFFNDLKLVKIDDPERQSIDNKPVYQLMTGKQYLEESIAAKHRKKETNPAIKGEKVVTISSKIGAKDLDVKLDQILKLLNRKYIVNLYLNYSKEDEKEEIFADVLAKLEKSILGIGTFFKQNSKKGLKLQITPLLPATTEELS